VDLAYTDLLNAILPVRPTEEELISFAAGRFRQAADVGVKRNSENFYTFSCGSSDFRVLETALLDPAGVKGYNPPGHATHVLAVFLGFGVNFLSVIKIRDRLILNNGTNRSFVLYERGIRRIPCLVREVACEDDLDVMGALDIKQNLAVYLGARRPPRLRDFFDPHLRKLVPVVNDSRMIHVQVSTQRSK
jgi:hypothetical protein